MLSGQNNGIWGYFLRPTQEKSQAESSEAPSSSNGWSRKFELMWQRIHQKPVQVFQTVDIHDLMEKVIILLCF